MTRGFSLVEVLVAVFIFAVIAAVAYGSVNTLLTSQRVIGAQNARLAGLQYSITTLERDLRQIQQRQTRDGQGAREAVLAGRESLLSLSRGGFSNPLARSRADLERCGYALRDGSLLRLSFPVLDRTPATVPDETVLLDRVNALRFRYFDGAQWLDQWPPPNREPARFDDWPVALRVVLEIEDLGRIERLVDLPPVPSPQIEGASP